MNKHFVNKRNCCDTHFVYLKLVSSSGIKPVWNWTCAILIPVGRPDDITPPSTLRA